jgi:hypothetical protein
MSPRTVILLLLTITEMASCKKWKDEKGPTDPRLSRKYCNDPEAVNYNWDFPGTPDNSVCFYPSDGFKGAYSFTDSIFNAADNKFIKTINYTLYFGPRGKQKFAVSGFCSNTDSVFFTSNRYYRALGDTLVRFSRDTTTGAGQLFCRTLDTLSGSIDRVGNNDSFFNISLTVVSDTGTTLHTGTAVKQ